MTGRVVPSPTPNAQSPTPALYPRLFSPIRIGPVTLANRLVFTSTSSALSHEGRPTQRSLDFYSARARGGVGLVVSEALNVHPTSSLGSHYPDLWSDEAIPAFARLVAAVQAEGPRMFAQLNHAGRQWHGGYTFLPVMAPSALPAAPIIYEVPHVMDADEIAGIVGAFGAAARRARAAGFDGVEIHGAHGFLFMQFLSPFSNQRPDRYGGSLENRMRFGLEVVEAVRAAAGRDLAVGLRLSADEIVPGGLTAGEMQEIARRFAATGRLDYFSISIGGFATIDAFHPTMGTPAAPLAPHAARIRAAANLPVLCVGKISDAATAERLLAGGQADLVGMSRPLICDPDLPRKAHEGREAETRGCIYCNYCHSQIFINRPVRCTYNAEAGREADLPIVPAAQRKRVLVVGGGPAGMEAARVAALRGHGVTLVERGPRLGGQTLIAARAPHKAEFLNIARYYEHQLRLLGVDVRLGTEATAEGILAEAPDAVVVATGSVPHIPALKGVDGPRVATCWQVLLGQVVPGRRAVVIDGQHHLEAPSVAEFLAERGTQVELISPHFFVGPEIEINTLLGLYRSLTALGVTLTPMTEPVEIADGTLIVRNVFTKQEREILDVDTIVLAMGGAADDRLYAELKGRIADLHRAGDCVAPRLIPSAVLEGSRVGRAL